MHDSTYGVCVEMIKSLMRIVGMGPKGERPKYTWNVTNLQVEAYIEVLNAKLMNQ